MIKGTILIDLKMVFQVKFVKPRWTVRLWVQMCIGGTDCGCSLRVWP